MLASVSLSIENNKSLTGPIVYRYIFRMKKGSKPYLSGSSQTVFSTLLARQVIDALSAHIAVLDENGVILETNLAWQAFAEKHRMPVDYAFKGTNYLDVCRITEGMETECACSVADGIRAVITGDQNEFLLDYPCHSKDRQRWFYLRVVRISTEAPLRIVVSHEDITELKRVEKALKESHAVLTDQNRQLEEANVALKVLLDQREKDKRDLDNKVLSNVKNRILPYMDKLKRSSLKSREKNLVALIDSQLADIVNPLLQHLTNAHILLTPQEIQVADLIRDGKSSKEIADILSVSESTIHFHRKNLRKKFGLSNTRINLRSHLLTLEY